MALSKGDLTRAGAKIREAASEEDIPQDAIDAYHAYRESFAEAIAEAMAATQACAGPDGVVTSRPKTLHSVREKLLRQPHTRLPQIEDIAGCRVVVSGLQEQDRVVAALQERYEGCRVNDLRVTPHSGYRAVHVIVRTEDDLLVEIQVRTRAQNVWANLSEKMAVQIDPAIKYGGGDAEARKRLDSLSEVAKVVDERSQTILDLSAEITILLDLADGFRQRGEATEALEVAIQQGLEGRARLRYQLEELDGVLEAFEEAARSIAEQTERGE